MSDIRWRAVLLRLGVGICIVIDWTSAAQPRQVYSCSSISYIRPREGYAYQGKIDNTDYGFSAVIPSGLIGWGVFSPAPFHGFTIFLDKQATSCINFEISLHVSPPEGPLEKAPSRGRARVHVGNKAARNRIEVGRVGGAEIENVVVTLGLGEMSNLERPADVTIILVSPTDDLRSNESFFHEFLASFHFD